MLLRNNFLEIQLQLLANFEANVVLKIKKFLDHNKVRYGCLH